MNYGVYFKKARHDSGYSQKHDSGYSQKEVANKLHIHQSNVSDWENDVSRPEYEKLVALAKLYDVSLYDLLGVPDEERF